MTLLYHSVAYLFARGVPGLVGLAGIVIYTRLLPTDEYGRYALVLTIAVLGNAILYQWLNASLLRFFPEYQNKEKTLLHAILGFFALISILVGIAGVFLVLAWADSKWRALVLLCMFIIWAQAWFTINLELMRSRLTPVIYGLFSTLKAVVALGVGVSLVLLEHGAYGALLGLLIGFSIAGIWASWNKWTLLGQWEFDWDLARKLLGYGLPLAASFSLAVMISSMDRLMIAGLLGEQAVGQYAASQGLVQQTVGVLMTMINLAAYPLIVRALDESGEDAARNQLSNNVVLLLGVGVPVAAWFIIFAPGLAEVVLGKDFQKSGAMLVPWFALAALLAGIRAYYFDLAFFLGKCTHLQLWVLGTAALLNFALNLYLIPQLGLLGAVYASVIAHGGAIVVSVIMGRRVFRLPVWNMNVVKVFASVLLMVMVLFLIPEGDGIAGLAVSIAVGGLVYLACATAFDLGGIRREMIFRITRSC